MVDMGGKVLIGNNFFFSLGKGVNPIACNLQGAIYLENGASLKIGNNVGMSSTRMWIHDSVTIGDNVKIGACVLITDTDAHSIILKGVTIGARSIIGAGSVVTKSIPADCVAAGNPCRVIKNLK